VGNLLDTIVNDSRRIRNALFAVEQFHTVLLAEVRRATEELTEAYDHLRETIRGLGQSAGLSVSYGQGQTAEQEEYMQRIAQGLVALFCQAQEAEQPAASRSTG
jgi:response regulator RpfG family c-di-GMP phosphodiesterase